MYTEGDSDGFPEEAEDGRGEWWFKMYKNVLIV